MKLTRSNLHLHFSLQDMSQEPPAQELVAKDLHGSEWRFRHIYRGTYVFLWQSCFLGSFSNVKNYQRPSCSSLPYTISRGSVNLLPYKSYSISLPCRLVDTTVPIQFILDIYTLNCPHAVFFPSLHCFRFFLGGCFSNLFTFPFCFSGVLCIF